MPIKCYHPITKRSVFNVNTPVRHIRLKKGRTKSLVLTSCEHWAYKYKTHKSLHLLKSTFFCCCCFFLTSECSDLSPRILAELVRYNNLAYFPVYHAPPVNNTLPGFQLLHSLCFLSIVPVYSAYPDFLGLKLQKKRIRLGEIR